MAAYRRHDERRARPDAPPSVLIADTTAGRGVELIEDQAAWHVGYLDGPDDDEAARQIRDMYGRKDGAT